MEQQLSKQQIFETLGTGGTVMDENEICYRFDHGTLQAYGPEHVRAWQALMSALAGGEAFTLVESPEAA
jgi:hypothetical protein